MTKHRSNICPVSDILLTTDIDISKFAYRNIFPNLKKYFIS